MEELVSICVPTYNNGRYLCEMLSSVIRQSHSNFEVIVTDNASTDDSAAVVSRFARIDDRVRYIRNESNVGYVDNVNRAVTAAKGRLICIFHSDDIYHPEIVRRSVALLNSRPTVGAVFSVHREFEINVHRSRRTDVFRRLSERLPVDQQVDAYIGGYRTFVPFILAEGNCFSCPTFVGPRDVYRELGGYDPDYPSSEDLALWIRYLQEGYQLAILRSPMLWYRRSTTQGSSVYGRMEALSPEFRILDELIAGSAISNKVIINAYRTRKAMAMADVALIAHRRGHRETARRLTKKSIEQMHLTGMNGLLQRRVAINNINARLRKIVRRIRVIVG